MVSKQAPVGVGTSGAAKEFNPVRCSGRLAAKSVLMGEEFSKVGALLLAPYPDGWMSVPPSERMEAKVGGERRGHLSKNTAHLHC